jgi:hypothetical protein
VITLPPLKPLLEMHVTKFRLVLTVILELQLTAWVRMEYTDFQVNRHLLADSIKFDLQILNEG